MQVPDTASAALSTTMPRLRCNGATPAPGEHQIGLSRTLSASSGAVTVSGPPSMTRSMNSVRLASLGPRGPTSRTWARVCTASPPLERLPAAADSAGPQAGRYWHAGTAGTVSLVTT